MGKNRTIKAVVMVVVMFFYSFVLVPKANATVFEAALARQAFMAASPYAVLAIAAGLAIKIMIDRGDFTDILIMKSAAITSLKDWWNSNIGTPTGTNSTLGTEIGSETIFIQASTGEWNKLVKLGNGNYSRYLSYNGGQTWSYNNDISEASAISLFAGRTINTPPSSTTDYGTELASTQPSVPANTVFASQGAAARVSSGAQNYGISVSYLSDSEVGAILDAFGGSAVDSQTGAQEGVAGPTPNDNTMTEGASQQIGLLTSILAYMSNLVGIKEATEATQTSVDNVAVIVQSQASKLDNIAVLTQEQKATMDNVLIGVNAQTQAIQGVEEKISHLDNAITVVSATSGSVQTRIDSLKTLASTKFPFSLAGSLSVSAVSGASSYQFDPLPLTPTISISIDPMAGPLAGTFTWFRQMIVWFFWVGTLFAILKKGMEM